MGIRIFKYVILLTALILPSLGVADLGEGLVAYYPLNGDAIDQPIIIESLVLSI